MPPLSMLALRCRPVGQTPIYDQLRGERINSDVPPLRRWVKLCFRGLCREDAVTGSLADKAVMCCGQGSPGRRGRDTSQDSR